MNKDIQKLGLWVLLCFVIVFIVIATITLPMQRQLDELKNELDHKDEVIQNLRNDLNDLDWYYENRLHFKDLEDDVRDIAIEDLYDRLLEDYYTKEELESAFDYVESALEALGWIE